MHIIHMYIYMYIYIYVNRRLPADLFRDPEGVDEGDSFGQLRRL